MLRHRRTKKRGTRKHRGGGYSFNIVLFSSTIPSSTLIDKLKATIATEFGSTSVGAPDKEGYAFYSFAPTGLRKPYKSFGNHFETLFTVHTVPEILMDKSISVDGRLTRLEGRLGLALLNNNIKETSLISAPHGIRPNTNNGAASAEKIYVIGLCTPACGKVDKRQLNSYLTHT